MCRWVGPSCLAVLAFVLTPVVCFSAEDVPAKSVSVLRKTTDAAMDAIRGDDIPGLIDALGEIANWNEDVRLKNLQKVAEGRGALRNLMGPPEDQTEYLKAQSIGRNFVQLIYIEHRAGGIVIWRFIFHRPRNEWRLAGFHWDANAKLEQFFEDVPEESASNSVP